MTHSLVFSVALRLLRGHVLRTTRHTVGPCPQVDGEPIRYVCLDARGRLVRARERWDETDMEDDDRNGYSGGQRIERERADWSPFGAARAFVMVESASAIVDALGRRAT